MSTNPGPHARTRMQFPVPDVPEELVLRAERFPLQAYKNMPLADFSFPLNCSWKRAYVPIVEGRIRSGRDFKPDWRIDVGRSPNNDIVVDSDLVSEYHGSFIAYAEPIRRPTDDNSQVTQPTSLARAIARAQNTIRLGKVPEQEPEWNFVLMYVDRNSTNGSYLNGRRIEGRVQVVPKEDRISIGGVFERDVQKPEDQLFEFDIFADVPRPRAFYF